MTDNREIGRIGYAGGWPIDIYSDDHNPPVFHYGEILFLVEEEPPKTVEDLRAQILSDNADSVDDAQLAELLEFLEAPRKIAPEATNYEIIQLFRDIFDDPELGNG